MQHHSYGYGHMAQKNGYRSFRGDPDAWNEWVTYSRTCWEGILSWPGISTTCHSWIWIKGMNHILGDVYGYASRLWIACGSRVRIGALHFEPWPISVISFPKTVTATGCAFWKQDPPKPTEALRNLADLSRFLFPGPGIFPMLFNPLKRKRWNFQQHMMLQMENASALT